MQFAGQVCCRNKLKITNSIEYRPRKRLRGFLLCGPGGIACSIGGKERLVQVICRVLTLYKLKQGAAAITT